MRITSSGNFAGLEWNVRRASNLDNMRRLALTEKLLARLKANSDPVVRYYMDIYTRMVVQGHGDGQFVRGFQTLDGTAWDVPPPEADVEVHLNAFRAYQDTDPELTDKVYSAIEEVDKPLGERHFLPEPLQTDEEHKDPLPDSGGTTPRNGLEPNSAASPGSSRPKRTTTT